MDKKITYAAMSIVALNMLSSNAKAVDDNSDINEETGTIQTITIVGDKPVPASSTVVTQPASAARESADLLRDLPGFSGSRMGGHGTDPTIRGLSQNRLNILLDGAYVHGACPNRMDPPTAYAPVNSYEKITVIKGMQTLEYGGGGPGGTVLFERETQRFDSDDNKRGKVQAGYRDNSNTGMFHADVATGNENAYVRFLGSYTDAGNYQDGDGDTVRSSYEQTAGAIIAGYTPSDDTRFELSLESQNTRDILFPGAGMDSPRADNDTVKLNYRNGDLNAQIYHSDVDHVMDNYTLRENTTIKLRAPSTSKTLGGRIVNEFNSKFGRIKLGVDIKNNERNADRFNDSAGGKLQSVLWPDAQIDQAGLFTEITHDLNQSSRMVAGLRYERVNAEVDRADNKVMGGLSPNQLYNTYYGMTARKHTEDNIAGLLRFEKDLNEYSRMYAGLSRSVRTADATERYIASNNPNASMRWVGNPQIDPEVHHQFETGVEFETEKMSAQFSIFYNDVADYILRDRFHQADNNATIYRNIDARLIGGELNFEAKLSASFSATFGLGYVHAENTTDDRAIAQTPPLEAIAGLAYHSGKWQLGSKIRAAAKQTRVDLEPVVGSGLDAQKTPSWAVLDLTGGYKLSSSISLDFGVDNVFDKDYAQHLNRANSFDPTQIQVDEPGRSAWLKITGSF